MIDPVVRCPNCGITVFTSSDSVSEYCAVCEPRFVKAKRKRGGGNSRRGRAARRNSS